jgi:hypothetical protein
VAGALGTLTVLPQSSIVAKPMTTYIEVELKPQ